ncbi:MAG: DEAD/DEAH box helicase [Acidobacteriota bacterium]|nr:DEAD/DEAH box helicase [Blastocatellia bacterium]MDW8413839.1 DEAD/DEAH box helicase [Acidobacteriota bacterium]
MKTLFDLHSLVMADYRDYVRSFILISDERARSFVETAFTEEGHFWPETLVQLSPAYLAGSTVDELSKEGLIAPETARIFRRPSDEPYRLYRHQEEAIRSVLEGHSIVVTSGTGSGKSLCYFLPIINNLIRNPQTGDRVAALVVYPMNALVNSQFEWLMNLKQQYENRFGRDFPVTFAKYTGETRDSERDEMRRKPPQILLTNYVMVELLLVRPEDQRFLDRVGGGLRFLVFDELHTYRGRQGADVAMLVRRLKERCAGPKLVHIGTSATMIAHREATFFQRRETVAKFASVFFGHQLKAEQVIEETLVPFSEGGKPLPEELQKALLEPLDTKDFRRHPLVRYLEYELGIEQEAGGRLKRRVPRPLSEIAGQLSEVTGIDSQSCAKALRDLLVVGSTPANGSGPLFAFKLHQFISQGGTLYATLEDRLRREFSLEGQVQASEGRLFLPVKFCRQCGQDYYHALQTDNQFLPHPLGAEPDEEALEGKQAGYLMLAYEENDWSPEQIPEEWYNAKGKLKSNYRQRIPQEVWVSPDGSFSRQSKRNLLKMWWQPEPFSLCLACGEFYTAREREFVKLSVLSSEGRSSATTILTTSLLRHASSTRAARDKLLTFTDNRQDASFQAGHFNDFVHVGLLRAALYAALKAEKELTFDRIAQAVTKASGLNISDIAKNVDLDPGSSAAKDVWQAFTDLTEYRLYYDLQRGWRVNQPNLEQ